MNNQTTLLILGGGGHGRVAADTARCMGFSRIAFLDDAAKGRVGAYDVVGTTASAREHVKDACFFVAVGNPTVRRRLFEELKALGARVVSLIHPSAVIGENVTIGGGVIVAAGAVVQPDAVIGDGVIVNTCASIDHDSTVGAFCHVSVGARLAGTVHVGEMTMIGAGAVVINNVNVAARCTIGAGAVVVRDLETAGTYKGVPARLG